MNHSLGNWLHRNFFAVVAAVLAIKVILAWLAPLTGDEAYFYVWGRHLDYGYYDHPPLAGWWMALAMQISRHPVVLRAPAILVSMVPGVGLYLYYRRRDESKARLVALLGLLAPLFMFGILITTDTPLVLFGLLSIGLCQAALKNNRKLLFLLSGLCLGMAFSSKYFAVLIGFGILAHFLIFARHRLSGLGLLVAGALPAVALNLHWNWHNCWHNLMFNLVHRGGGGGGMSWGNVPGYLLTLLYLITPWVLWQLWRRRRQVMAGLRDCHLDLWWTVSLVPLGLFLILSPTTRIGMHWLAVFIPGLLAGGFFLPAQDLRRLVGYSAIFAALHLLLLSAILIFPIRTLADHSRYLDLVFHLRPARVAENFTDYPGHLHFFTSSYSRSAILSYYSNRHFGVWGTGSRYGRQDDMITDFSALDGADIVYFGRRGEIDQQALAPYFERLDVREFTVAKGRFQVAEARGFNYSTYRENILKSVRDRYHTRPQWVPGENCKFCRRHGFDN